MFDKESVPRTKPAIQLAIAERQLEHQKNFKDLQVRIHDAQRDLVQLQADAKIMTHEGNIAVMLLQEEIKEITDKQSKPEKEQQK